MTFITGLDTDNANCNDPWIDPDTFFRITAIEEAKEICQGCPIINQCAAYALKNPEITGVWGGLSEADRKILRKNTRTQSRRGIPNKKH